MKKKLLKFGIPSGSLQLQTQRLFETAGYDLQINQNLSFVTIDDLELECLLAKPREIASYIEKGILDAGITGHDALLEAKTKIIEICDLGYTKDKWEKAKVVLAVPENSSIKTVLDLKGKRIAKEFLKKHWVSARIEFSDASNEPKVPSVADALIEFTNTGATLRAHGLKILETLMETSVILATNKDALKDTWKREKIEELKYVLAGARLAQEYTGVMLPAQAKFLKKVLLVLPALKGPTITRLEGKGIFDILTIAKKQEMRALIPRLKKMKCADIVEFPVNKIIL
jgi:ATP phosphoribosyltransferase